ncbi:MAG: cell division protein FtsW [Lachnospiraceae bacterium]|nr:cell division protein FtsW [Lachnospiraceae bacterium]
MKNKNNSQPAKKKKNLNAVSGIDWMLVLIVVVLLIFGLIMLYSASSYNSQIKFGTSAWYVKKQIFSTLIGLVGMFVIAFVPVNFWRKAAISLYILGVISVLLILTPLGGEEINGAKRWLDLKVISVQPAEILKIALVAAMAFFIAKFIKYLDDWRIYVIGFSICLIACALTLFVTDDLGTAIIIFAMGFVMMLVAAPRVLYLIITIVVALAAVVGVILIKPNKLVRVKAWMHLDQYSDDIGYQITQALYAIGSGGIFGKGLGKSTQKMGFVPESENDMIFSIICEELGIIGGIILILLIVLLIWRMKKIYDKTDDIFGKVMVAGVATHIAMQTFVNIGVVSNLLPNTGVPLPFMSYGGTAILFLLAEIGIVLAVGRVKQKDPVDKRKEYYRRDKERGVIYFQ